MTPIALATLLSAATATAAPRLDAPAPAPAAIQTSTEGAQRDDLDRGRPDVHRFHGARIGYVLSAGADDYGYSPHNVAMGYEWFQVVDGGARVDFLMVQNALVIGLNQGLFVPAGNALFGFEVDETLQVGVGANLNLGELVMGGQALGMVGAVGLVMEAGDFNVPVHLSVVPRVDEVPRIALTTGVNW